MASQRPRIVIVGSGFGGLFAARALAKADASVVVVDRHNYHLFQPLLYQVATAGLAPSDVAWPIRSLLARQRNLTVRLGEVTGVDIARRLVVLDGGSLEYEFLILATGARHAYFGHDEWARWAPGLKSVDDATAIRRRLLLAFEQAENCDDGAQRDRLLRFVIVGAGPTGVELAGAIAELAHHTLARDFRRIDPRSAKILLVEAGPCVLPSFTNSMSGYAKRSLEKLGVEVRLDSRVTDCNADGVEIEHSGNLQRMPAATVLWAAGVAASPVGFWLGAATDQQGRVTVLPDLSTEVADNVFVVGDAAAAVSADGSQVPGTAPAAKQQGRYVGKLIGARLAGKVNPPPFRYRHAGNLATIGRRSAVVEFGRLKLKGRIAWWLWGVAHVYFLIGQPSRLIVAIRWLWEYSTYRKGARLITGDTELRPPAARNRMS